MKLFHVIATSVLGTAMALGTGFVLANKQNVKQARAANTVTITPATSGWTSTAGEQTGTVDGITVSTDSGIYNTQMRVYADATSFVVSSSVGNFTKIEFTFSSGAFTSVNVGSYTSGTWTGDAASASFSNTAQVRITNMVITLKDGGADPDPEPDPEPGDKITNYTNIVAGNYYIGATTSGTDYYFKAATQTVGNSNSGTSTTNKAEATIITFAGSGNSWSLQLPSGNYLSLSNSKDNGKYNVVENAVNWTLSNQNNLIRLAANGSYSLQKNNTGAQFGSYNNNQTDIWLEAAESKTLQSITLSKNDAQVKKAYFVGETASTAGLTVMANYDSGDPVDVTVSSVITPNPATVELATTSISYTATFGGKTSNSVTVTGITVTKVNPLQALYSKASGSNATADGIYMGKQEGDGVVIMDGEYGFLLGNRDLDVSGYTVGETVLHAEGKIYVAASGQVKFDYSGLTVSEQTDASVIAAIETPVVYSVKGDETVEYSGRSTTITGTVKTIAPKTSAYTDYEWDGTEDVTITVTVGTRDVTVFYKRGAQDPTVGAKIVAGLNKELTFKGFTSWYNAIQVAMTGLVEAVETYTAEDFAQDLIDQTDAVCTGWVEGDNNHDAMVAIWSNLASEDKYPSLPSGQKQILAEADADEGGNIVEQAMARYDYLTVRYNLNNFINGRLGGSESNRINNSIVNNNTMMIVVIASTITIVSLAGLFFIIRKRKHQ